MIQLQHRVDGQKRSILSILPLSTGKSHVGEWDRMVCKLGSPRELSALQEHRAVWDRQWSHELPSSPSTGYGFSGLSASALLPGHSPASKPALGAAHKLPELRSHTLATLGEEMFWLCLNKLVQLLEALWLLGAKKFPVELFSGVERQGQCKKKLFREEYS